MNLVNSIALVLSGGLIVGSILLAEFGFRKSTLSKRASALLVGIGVGLASGLFVFYGINGANLFESIVISMIAAITAGITEYISLGKFF